MNDLVVWGNTASASGNSNISAQVTYWDVGSNDYKVSIAAPLESVLKSEDSPLKWLDRRVAEVCVKL